MQMSEKSQSPAAFQPEFDELFCQVQTSQRSLREVVGQLWARRWPIAACAATCALLGMAGFKMTAPKYRAEAPSFWFGFWILLKTLGAIVDAKYS